MDKLQIFFKKVLLFFQGPKLDPSVFNDPIAFQVSWKPLHRGGSRRKNKELRRDESGSMWYVSIKEPKILRFLPTLLFGFFTFAGWVLIAKAWESLQDITLSTISEDAIVTFMMLGAGCIIVLVFLSSLKRSLWPKKQKTYLFNIMNKTIYQIVPDNTQTYENIPIDSNNIMRFDDVHAIQIVDESVRRKKNEHYTSYEINLILQNTTRVHIIDHSKYGDITLEAKKLGQLLNVPVWNAAEVASRQYEEKFKQLNQEQEDLDSGFISGDDDLIDD